jgi:enoyl-CoA hydratase/carnithine racemase
MELENIILEKKDHIAVVTLNHPPVNAWDLGTTRDFEKAIDDVEKDENIRVVIITGGGDKSFSAGFDIKDAANGEKIGEIVRALWVRIDRFGKPVIAAINGFAMGGGLELALCCHFRLMADAPNVTLGLTELNLGIIPGWGGTQRLMRVVGKARALDMILFSKRIDARECLEIGLINKACAPEKLMADAQEFAGLLCERPPIAVSCVLKAMSAGEYEGIAQGLKTEHEGTKTVSQSKDCIEGFTAFLEKRQPVFQGK